ncbi:MAG: Unknown protein [uncultured Sulfurovum sp.]|uniref:Uncharacterized protein n=1 Tax=uncultured Sulfurovum sp. TaxID=269237 RepID=A0A6S6U7L5_9BACT|nr:MAG: Unknown protein [uncultured Sulfurovum sp.]
MKNRLLKLLLGASLLMGVTIGNAGNIEHKMIRHIIHGTPWIETRLSYAMSVNELAEKYYGNMEEVHEIMKVNKNIHSPATILHKNLTVSIPVIASFTEQPERLGWVH